MSLFNKLFKSDCEGLIEAYLQSYKKIKSSPQFQVAAELFEDEFKMAKEFHFANTTVMARRYGQYQQESLMTYFMTDIASQVEKTKTLDETQLLVALLKAAHYVEAGDKINRNFEFIASEYIPKYFKKNELSKQLYIRNFDSLLKR